MACWLYAFLYWLCALYILISKWQELGPHIWKVISLGTSIVFSRRARLTLAHAKIIIVPLHSKESNTVTVIFTICRIKRKLFASTSTMPQRDINETNHAFTIMSTLIDNLFLSLTGPSKPCYVSLKREQSHVSLCWN